MTRITLFLLAIFASVSLFAADKLTEEDLANLDKELELVPMYDKMKYERIDSLKQILNSANRPSNLRIDAALKLGAEYRAFISDSSMVYYRKAMALAYQYGDSSAVIEAKIGHFNVLGVLGFFGEAVHELNTLEEEGVPESLQFLFYDSARQLYYYMQGYTENSDVAYSADYFQKNREYRNKILELLDSREPLYQLYYAEVLQDQGKISQSREVLTHLMSNLPQGNDLVARIASTIARLDRMAGNPESAAHFCAVSAIYDIKGSIKENTSLQTLATYLYATGDIARAYHYICISLDDANFCNARLRNMEISRNMPLINSAYKNEIDTKNRTLLIAIVVETILAVGLVIAVMLILYQMRKLSIARKSLKLANKVKEDYMGHFLNLCSIYMERLASYNRTVARKVTAGQIDDLLKLTKSTKFADEQNKLFYENFDSAFLHIYPTFVDDFNALLQPEERIEVKELGKLTMELRIFAFLRLGIEDSNKIASFLRYSVNTIYSYRNKIRNKAINRDTFDEDVKKIGMVKE